jgi:hypothetical protein
MSTSIRTTKNGKPAPFVPVKSGTTLPGSSLGSQGRSKSVKGGAYMKKSKRKSMKKSRKSTRR